MRARLRSKRAASRRRAGVGISSRVTRPGYTRFPLTCAARAVDTLETMVMLPIRWRREMSVDNGIIDDDHRHLIDIINSFSYHRARGRADLPHAMDCLNALKFYANTHFAREERLQLMVGYPE